MFNSTHWMPAQKPQGEPLFTMYIPLSSISTNTDLISLLENGGFNVGEESRTLAQVAIDGGLGDGMGETCELVSSMSAALGISTTDDKGPESSTPSIFIPATGMVLMNKTSSKLQSRQGNQMLHVIIDVAWATDLLQKNNALLRKLQEYMRK